MNADSSSQDAIQKLRDTEEILKKRQDFLEQKISKELLIAKQNGIRNKRVTLQALKRKKRYQQHLARIDGILCNIENQREALENASTTREVLDTMSTAAATLKMAHQNMDTDSIDKLMTEITEQQEIGQEILDAISTPTGFADDIDELLNVTALPLKDELLSELEELKQEEIEEELQPSQLPSAPSELPSIPTFINSWLDPASFLTTIYLLLGFHFLFILFGLNLRTQHYLVIIMEQRQADCDITLKFCNKNTK
ncbi:CHM4C protein, partial [Polypterus senegalus]|nr:CHM4C protein [Polypterus senegalus]